MFWEALPGGRACLNWSLRFKLNFDLTSCRCRLLASKIVMFVCLSHVYGSLFVQCISVVHVAHDGHLMQCSLRVVDESPVDVPRSLCKFRPNAPLLAKGRLSA